MDTNESKFDIWWNSPEVKQRLGAAYSLGASVVIIGAMFKILHLNGSGLMLGIGMSVEAILFALGIFDKPHRDYEWEKIYNFDGDSKANLNLTNVDAQINSNVVKREVGLNYSETIDDEDVKKLSESIKNLTTTAQQFASLSNVIDATDHFVENINVATQTTGKFINSQENLNTATSQLSTSYLGITEGMDTVEKNTKLYVGKLETINKNLASINSIYEIQLKNIQAQSEGLTQQNERLRSVNDELGFIVTDFQKMKLSTSIAANEVDLFKVGTTKLAEQVSDLNKVYGNMLNALS